MFRSGFVVSPAARFARALVLALAPFTLACVAEPSGAWGDGGSIEGSGGDSTYVPGAGGFVAPSGERSWEADAAVHAAGPGPVPHVIAWNLTRRCNLECSHCYISAGSWHAADGEMSTADCLRVVDEILEVSPAPMLILSGGEPLLREDLETIARRAADGGATVVVGTNGTRLTRERMSCAQTPWPRMRVKKPESLSRPPRMSCTMCMTLSARSG